MESGEGGGGRVRGLRLGGAEGRGRRRERESGFCFGRCDAFLFLLEMKEKKVIGNVDRVEKEKKRDK